MIRINGNIIIEDGWVVDKYSKSTDTTLLDWEKFGFYFPYPDCDTIYKSASNEDAKVVTSLTGKKFIVRCNSLQDLQNPQQPRYSINVDRPSQVRVNDVIYINVEIDGSVVIGAYDNYDKFFTFTKTQLVPVKITNRYNKYILKYRACSGSSSSTGSITIDISPDKKPDRKTININGCSRQQASILSSLVNQRVVIEDGYMDGSNMVFDYQIEGIITKLNLKYIADDMADFPTSHRQNVAIYNGTVEVLTE